MDFPSHVFNGDYVKANVLINADERILKEEINRLSGCCHYGELYRPEYGQQLLKLQATVAAMKTFQDVFFKKMKNGNTE